MTVQIEKERWLLASTLFNLFLSLVKLGWGLWLGSTLVTADAVHGFSDVFGAFLIYIALRMASHKSTLFPRGMPKLENFAAFAGGIGIFFAGYEIARAVFFESGVKSPENMLSTLIFIATLTLMEIIFYRYELSAAKRLASPGIISDATNWLGDIGAGIVVVVGIIAHMFHIPYAQEAAVIIVLIMIFKGGYEVLRDAILALLDASVESELLDKARKVVLRVSGVYSVDQLSLRRSGSGIVGSITIEVDEKTTAKAHAITHEVELAMHEAFDNLERVNIHYEPPKKSGRIVARLLDDKGAESSHFGDTVIIELSSYDASGKRTALQTYPNPFLSNKGKGIRLAAWMITHKVDEIVFDPTRMEEDIVILLDAMGIKLTTTRSTDAL